MSTISLSLHTTYHVGNLSSVDKMCPNSKINTNLQYILRSNVFFAVSIQEFNTLNRFLLPGNYTIFSYVTAN